MDKSPRNEILQILVLSCAKRKIKNCRRKNKQPNKKLQEPAMKSRTSGDKDSFYKSQPKLCCLDFLVWRDPLTSKSL